MPRKLLFAASEEDSVWPCSSVQQESMQNAVTLTTFVSSVQHDSIQHTVRPSTLGSSGQQCSLQHATKLSTPGISVQQGCKQQSAKLNMSQHTSAAVACRVRG